MDKRDIAKTTGSLATGLAMTAVGVAFALPALAVGSAALYAVAGYFWWDARRSESIRPKAPGTLFEDFQRFSPLLALEQAPQLTIIVPGSADPVQLDVPFKFHFDWLAKSDYASIYLPSAPPGVGARLATYHLPAMVLPNRDELQNMVTTSITVPGDREMPTSKSSFSGRVYLYHEDSFTFAELAAIEAAFAVLGLDVHLRGPEYAAVHKLSVPRKVYPPATASP